MSSSLDISEERRRVGILFHPHSDDAKSLAKQLVSRLEELGAETALLSAWDESALCEHLGRLDWVVSLGGDGSLVRIARQTAQYGLPILGVNFGRLGFLSELQPDEALERVPEGLTGAGWLDTRLMLRGSADLGGQPVGPFDAVNDVFVGRGHTARLVRLTVTVDGVELVELAADGLIAATPTGSTAYSLSAGGPVVAPDLDLLLLTPVTPHPACIRPVVLPPGACIEVAIHTRDEATISVDGHLHYHASDGDSVRLVVGPHRVQLLRFRPPGQYYATVMERLRTW